MNRESEIFPDAMLDDVKYRSEVIVIDETKYNVLIDNKIPQEMFISKLATNRIMRSKFILLGGFVNKIERFKETNSTIHKLIVVIDKKIEEGKLSVEEMVKYFELLTLLYTKDLEHVEGLVIDLIKKATKM